MVKKLILSEFARNSWKQYVIGIITLIITSVLQTVTPKLMGYIIDCMKNKSVSQHAVFLYAGGLLGIAAIIFITKYICRYFLLGKARDLECFLRDKLFAHLQTLPVKFYNNKKTGDLMAYAINDLSAIRMAFSVGFVFVIDALIYNVNSIFIMVKTINPMLTLVAIGPVIVSLLAITQLRQIIRARFKIVQEAFADISDKVQENLSGIRVVKGFAQEDNEIEKIGKSSTNRIKVQMKYIKVSATLTPAVQVCFGLSYAMVLILGSIYVKKGIITLGDLVAMFSYLAILQNPVNNIGKAVEVWQRGIASIKRLDEIFDAKTDIVDENPVFNDEKLNGKIEIRDLTFKYPGSSKRALKNINITIEKGKTLGIIGRTGSGKSTLVNLLLRLYKIDRGLILIDGIDINDIPVATVRDNIGYVQQDNFLFSASIKDNIKLFNEVYTEGDVQEAARQSDIYDNIVDFPEGFETVVGERGVMLSGGQKQRISIARAVIKDPGILILDDCLSAVDTKTEEAILSNLKTILKGRTGIINAHRISTIKHADEIIVLDKGRIVERGNHEELLRLKGRYSDLYHAQMAESGLNGMEEAI